MLAFFHRLAPGAIAGELQHAFATSSASLGLLAATYFYIYFAMQVPSGILADTLGPRKLFTAGALVAGAGSVLFGLASDFGLALFGRFLVGLGVSVAFISVLKLNAAWFSERRFATMTGFLVFIGNMGGLLATVPLAWVAAHGMRGATFSSLPGRCRSVLARFHLAVPARQSAPAGAAVDAAAGRQAGISPRHRKTGAWRSRRCSPIPRTWPGFLMQFGQIGAYLSWGGLWAIPYLREVHGMERQLAAWHISLS